MKSSQTLILLHTAPAHINTFSTLLEEMAPDLPVRHVVHEDILHEVLAAGRLTQQLVDQVTARVTDLQSAAPDSLVLCTCSTIGGAAERAASHAGIPFVRVDRPMARRAVMLGSRIILAATLASTLQPTAELIRDEAAQAGKAVELIEVLCEGAWAQFEAGDRKGYLAAIAEALREPAQRADVVVLAQASMAGVEQVAADAIHIPILSSPRLGLEAALAVYRQGQPS